MPVDLSAAAAFVVTHARLLDRHRFDVLFEGADPAGLLAAAEAYRNADGGYGWGLEPDLRTRGSQPLGALHAFEAFEDCAPVTTPRAAELCDWLASVSLDGGLPFVLPIADAAGCAPWFVGADTGTASLHGTTAVVGAAHRLARHDPAVAGHPWLARAIRYCLEEIAAIEQPQSAYELLFVLQLLDNLHDDVPEAAAHLARLASTLPPSGSLPVEGGIEGEMLRPLDFAPEPGRPLREHLSTTAVEADLDRLAGEQQADGGWKVDFRSSSPAGELEWRGRATIEALTVLQANGRLA